MNETVTTGINLISDIFKSYVGSGYMFILVPIAVAVIAVIEKKVQRRELMIAYPAYALLIFLCPLWWLYSKKFNDSEILYRILWLIPTGVFVAYAIVKLTEKIGQKSRAFVMIAATLLLIVCGSYNYSAPIYSKAENQYHVPATVVKLCDEIVVPGREIRAAFPDEYITYVRQYTAFICLPYGRASDFEKMAEISRLKTILNAKTIDSKEAADELRATETPYLIVASDHKFSEPISEYGFLPVKSIDGYDIYLDEEAYIGLDSSAVN